MNTGASDSTSYSDRQARAVTSATVGVGEWDFTGATPSSVFYSTANSGNPVDFSASPNQLQQFKLADTQS